MRLETVQAFPPVRPCAVPSRPCPLRLPAMPRHSRVHALAAAAEHDIRRLLGLLLLLEQSHRAQGGVAGAHLLQKLQEEGRSAQGGSGPQATSHPSASRCGSRPPCPWAPTASSSSFFIRRSVFILPEPFPWKRWDSCRKACGHGWDQCENHLYPGGREGEGTHRPVLG